MFTERIPIIDNWFMSVLLSFMFYDILIYDKPLTNNKILDFSIFASANNIDLHTATIQ